MLFNGEQLGDGDGPSFDIAVDPVECTDLCAAGLPGSLSTIAFAGDGCLWSPGPAHYQDKLVVGPRRQGRHRPARELGVERQARRRGARQAGRRDARPAARQAPPRRARRAPAGMGVCVICPAPVTWPARCSRAARHRGRHAHGHRRDARGDHGRLRREGLGGGMQTRLAPQRDTNVRRSSPPGSRSTRSSTSTTSSAVPRSSRPAASPAGRCSRPAR